MAFGVFLWVLVWTGACYPGTAWAGLCLTHHHHHTKICKRPPATSATHTHTSPTQLGYDVEPPLSAGPYGHNRRSSSPASARRPIHPRPCIMRTSTCLRTPAPPGGARPATRPATATNQEHHNTMTRQIRWHSKKLVTPLYHVTKYGHIFISGHIIVSGHIIIIIRNRYHSTFYDLALVAPKSP